MKVVSVSCTNCGAPINLPEEIDQLNCSYCGAGLIVNRGDGYVSLKLAEKMSRAIEESGRQTQSTIQEGTQVTQVELKRLQISQEISSLQMQLSATQAEIRSLERQKPTSQIKRQLKELQKQEQQLLSNIRTLQMSFIPVQSSGASQAFFSTSPKGTPVPSILAASVEGHEPKDWAVTAWLALLLGWLGIHRFYTGYRLIGLIQLLTLGGLTIWWIIDLLLLATGKYRDARKQALIIKNPKITASLKTALIVVPVMYVLPVVGGLDPGTAFLFAVICGLIAYFLRYLGGTILSRVTHKKNLATSNGGMEELSVNENG